MVLKSVLHFFFSLCLGVVLQVNALANTIDSLKNLISTAKDTIKVNLMNDLSLEYHGLAQYDSAINYAREALWFSDKINYIKGRSNAFKNIAEAYYELEEFEKSIEYYSKNIEVNQIIGDRKGEAYCLHVIAILYRKLNDYDKAIEYEFKSLKIAEEIDDRQRIAYVSNGIAIIYQTLKQWDKALQHYENLLKISIELDDKTDIADAYNNIGTVYKEMKIPNKALNNYLKALAIYKKTRNKQGLALAYNNIGNLFILNSKLDSAKFYHEQSLLLEMELNRREGIAYSYSNIGNIYLQEKDFEKAISMKEKALTYTLENDLSQRIFHDLTQIYILKGDSTEAIRYHKLTLSLKDSIYSRETKNIVAELQTKYETEKKEKEILLLTKQKEVQDLELKKNQIFLYSISGILLLIISLAFVIYNAYKEKNKANLLLTHKNTEIIAQKQEIESQRDMLSKQKKQITDSILYAQNIQRAVLPSNEMMENNLPDHFVLFKPRDIVSGDFYWLKRIRNLVVFTAADCTGHGVPGAFMSMLGVSFLNEIVNDKEVNTAGEVLNRMREKVKSSLHQKGILGEQKDGMDMALCVLNVETNLLQFAGAFNPLYLIRKGTNLKGIDCTEATKTEESHTHTLFEIKATRQPVAIYYKEVDFITSEIQLLNGDTFYLFSDGFQDQLGGELGEKFKLRRLKKLLLDSVCKPMSEQKRILENAHLNWREDIEQIDDIVFIGVRI
jgi:serine phosphatase RsbU (regulator of sigma subunit)